MDTLFWIAAIIVLFAVAWIAGTSAFKQHMQKQAIDKLFEDFKALIESDYKSRLSGSNRFIVNPDTLRLIYTTASADEIEGLFKKLIDAKIIDRDPVDQAWSLR